MTAAAAEAALDRMETDEAFARRIQDAGGPEASITFLAEDGFVVTPVEMRDAVLDRYRDEMTPEQLDALSGGWEGSDQGATIGFAVAVGSIVAGFAAGSAAAV